MIYRLSSLNIMNHKFYISLYSSIAVEAVTRRIQQTGKSTYIVSLPREWVVKNNLKKFDQVKILPTSSGLLITRGEEREPLQTVIRVPEEANPEEVTRLFFSKYLAGYDKITVVFPVYSPQTVSILKERIRRWLIGVEIIGETFNELVVQCLPIHDKLPVKASLERMGSIASHMINDSAISFVKADVSLAGEVINRDDEVDRFYHFVVRQLNIAVKDYTILNAIQLTDPSECLIHLLVAKNVERAADHAVTICNLALSAEKTTVEEDMVIKLNELVVTTFRKALNSLLNQNLRAANETLNVVQEITSMVEMIDTRALRRWEGRELVLSVLYSMRRIAEYAGDIAEAAINLGSRNLT